MRAGADDMTLDPAEILERTLVDQPVLGVGT
jgi:hypothetical protein